MKRTMLTALAALALRAAPGLAQTPSADTVEIVVDLDDGTSRAEAEALGEELGIAMVPNSGMADDDGVYRARVPRAREEDLLERLRDDSRVQAADENVEMRALFTPNDPLLPQQWGLTRLGSERAWDAACGHGVTVAVVDTGVACENYGDFTRIPDLAGTRCVPGWNFVSGDEHANDDQGHGTHVAGTIAQTTHNALGGAGVAYCATILPVKVLDARGRGTLANVAEGIRWAADHGAQVINLSLGGGGRSKVLEEAVRHARSRGSIVICAAGNNGRYVESPANAPGAVAVSAIDSADQIAFFSSRGPEVAVAAPGVQILQQTICENGRNRCEQFASWSGTSMAAPHVAGVAALIYSLGVTDPDAVEGILRRSAVKPQHGDENPQFYGAGIVSAEGATRETLASHGRVRGITLLLLTLYVLWQIKKRNGEASWAFVPTALLTGVGAFFLPWFVSRTVPGIDLAMRPLAEWDLYLLGVPWHRWLLFANGFSVLGLVGIGFGRSWLRAPVGGVALGVAAYLAASLVQGDAYRPFGSLLFWAWVVLNTALCLWVATIGIDRKAR